MENKKLRLALIGCGMIGHGHARAVAADGRAEIVALAHGRDAKKGHDFAEQYKIPYVTGDWHDILNRGDIDAVIICTPCSLHAECTIAFANAGIPVFCEKPLDIESDKMTAMIEAAEQNGVLLGTVYPNRVQAGLREAKQILDSGALGKMRIVEFQYRGYRSQEYYSSSYWKGKPEFGGGCLMNQAVHGIDAMLYLTGNVKSVCAVCDTMGRDIEVEDTGFALMEFVNGAHGALMGTTLSYIPEKNPECERVRIECEKGTVVFADGKTVLYKSLSDTELKTEEIKLGKTIEIFGADPEDMDMEAHFELVSNFISAVLGEEELIIPARDGRRAIDLVAAIYESAKTRTWVDVPQYPF